MREPRLRSGVVLLSIVILAASCKKREEQPAEPGVKPPARAAASEQPAQAARETTSGETSSAEEASSDGRETWLTVTRGPVNAFPGEDKQKRFTASGKAKFSAHLVPSYGGLSVDGQNAIHAAYEDFDERGQETAEWWFDLIKAKPEQAEPWVPGTYTVTDDAVGREARSPMCIATWFGNAYGTKGSFTIHQIEFGEKDELTAFWMTFDMSGPEQRVRGEFCLNADRSQAPK